MIRKKLSNGTTRVNHNGNTIGINSQYLDIMSQGNKDSRNFVKSLGISPFHCHDITMCI